MTSSGHNGIHFIAFVTIIVSVNTRYVQNFFFNCIWTQPYKSMGPPHETWIKDSILAEENVSIFTEVQLLCQESLYCYYLPAWVWLFFIQYISFELVWLNNGVLSIVQFIVCHWWSNRFFLVLNWKKIWFVVLSFSSGIVKSIHFKYKPPESQILSCLEKQAYWYSWKQFQKLLEVNLTHFHGQKLRKKSKFTLA